MRFLIKKNMFYYTCYLFFYKNKKLLYLNECFLYSENNEVFYYYKEKVVEIIWSIIRYNNDQYYI